MCTHKCTFFVSSPMCIFSKPQYKVFGPQGGIDTGLILPEGFDPQTGKCDLLVLMHGFCASRRRRPISSLAKTFAKAGFAVLTFDFDAHGRSEGKFIDMTLSSEIADARAVAEYAKALPFVRKIAFVGHSQGGVIAGLLAGELENTPLRPDCLVQLAPAAVLKDDALAGRCMNAKYDASNPPEYVSVLFHKLGRKFILEAQKLSIIENSAKYSGKVCLVHGKKDSIVPSSYSVRYADNYSDSELHLLDKENHFLSKCRAEIEGIVIDFLRQNLL